MKNFKKLPEFEKEFQKLSKKYRSLPKDIEKFEKLLSLNPTGIGKNFTIIHFEDRLKIVKARLACRSLRDRSIRIIYAYHDETFDFTHIEIYFKGNKENEDSERIINYLASFE